jgi:hypothetical protein
MSAFVDHSALPTAPGRKRTDGIPPDPDTALVAAHLDDLTATRDHKPTAMGTRLRYSDAGKCARALSYRALDIPETDPMDAAGVWVTSLGTILHEEWQAVAARRWPDAVFEAASRDAEVDVSGSADAWLPTGIDGDGIPTVFELKTVGGFSYKAKVGAAPGSKPAEGPDASHVKQVALNGLGLGAKRVVIGYAATEAVSKPQAARNGLDPVHRTHAQWTYSEGEWEDEGHAELRRMAGILNLADDGVLAARKMTDPELPKGHEIVDPSTGRWEVRDGSGAITNTGSWWACGYCPWQSLCSRTPSGRVRVEEAK